MKLRGIEFGRVFNASGARNFFGEDDSYWFHHAWNSMTSLAQLAGARVGLAYEGCTFVAKTTTLEARAGNMPLIRGTTKPRALVPRCILMDMEHGAVLNKVGLSGPGLRALLDEGYWQTRVQPFVLSFMPVAATPELRLAEVRCFAKELGDRLSGFCAPIALQLNVSCPNTDHEQESLLGEVPTWLNVIARELPELPIIIKYSPELDPAIGVKIAGHEAVDAIAPHNTIRFGKFADRIDWVRIFGSDRSPLADVGGKDSGGGGLSGGPIRPLVLEWIAAARKLGFRKAIVGGGGVLHQGDIARFKDAGASAIEVGSASILRPWRVQSIIDEGNRLFI